MSRQTVSGNSNHEFRFTTTNGVLGADQTIILTFASGFSLASITVADVQFSHGAGTGEETVETLGSVHAASVWGMAVSGQTITFTPPTNAAPGEIAAGEKILIRIGTAVSGGIHQIVNPSSAGNYAVSLSGFFGGTSGLRVPIGSPNQTIGVTATMPAAPAVPPAAAPETSGGGGVGAAAVPPPIPPPLPISSKVAFTGIQILSVGTNTATISWKTNQAATGWVNAGLLASAYGVRVDTPSASTQQTVTLSGLSPATDYHFEVYALNETGVITSGEMRFATMPLESIPPAVVLPAPPSPVPAIPVVPPAKPSVPSVAPATPAFVPGSAPSGASSGSGSEGTPVSGAVGSSASGSSGMGSSSAISDGGTVFVPMIPTAPATSGEVPSGIPSIPSSPEPSIGGVPAVTGVSGSVAPTNVGSTEKKSETKKSLTNPFKSIKKEASVLANAIVFTQAVGENVQTALNTVRTPQVQAVAEVAAPVAIAAAATTVTVSASAASLFNYLYLLITQPLLLFNRRKREKWGMVYNALSKQPIDLAVVRLLDAETKAVIQTRITDAQGRFAFLATPGEYELSVVKANMTYPSQLLKQEKIDVDMVDLYHGERIQVTQTTTITPNIPVDPVEKTVTPREIVRKKWFRRIQHGLSIGSLLISVGAWIIQPSWKMGALLVGQIGVYALFRRLSVPAKPKSWGVVYDASSRERISHAVVRIFDKRFHKLLETQITDAQGKYAFFAGKNIYFVTADHPQYERFVSSEIDVQKQALAVIDPPLALTSKRIPQNAQTG